MKELAGKMEAPPYNLKFCIPWRDDLPGGSRYEVSAHMIATRYETIIKTLINLLKFDLSIACMGCSFRCRRTLVILSPDFLKSAAADFQLKFAHCLSPGKISLEPSIHLGNSFRERKKYLGFF